MMEVTNTEKLAQILFQVIIVDFLAVLEIMLIKKALTWNNYIIRFV